jgi:cysteine-rich repeat protein
MRAALLLLLSACGTDKASGDTAPWVAPGCGDGVVDAGEQCDDGAANADTPDACRPTCLRPACGDGVADSDEACDDGNAWGGDGCTPGCTAEDGALESEPNDSWDAAAPWPGETTHGALTEGDTDCFSLASVSCGAISAALSGDCAAPARLTLHGPDGGLLAVGGPGAGGCATLDPAVEPGARFLPAGDLAVCVAPVLAGVVPAWALDVAVGPIAAGEYTLLSSDDPDGDGLPDQCDDDRDGDGVLNEEDNCPDDPNGADPIDAATTSDGMLQTWLAAGPFDGRTSADRCLPTADALVHAEDDALATPTLGGAAGDGVWTLLQSGGNRTDLNPRFGSVSAPREVYLAAWIRSPEPTTATLALGPDDGARAWLDGAVVLEVASCQGTNWDQFTAEVALTGEWQPLLLKIYDQGGGWGTFARVLDADGAPLRGLEVALSADGPLVSDQGDADGDGLGDACDDDPTGR